jgi:hypothetical protein
MANITHFIGKWVQRLIIIGNIITHFRTGTPVLDQPESIEGQRVLKNVENRAFFFVYIHAFKHRYRNLSFGWGTHIGTFDPINGLNLGEL